MGGRAKRGIGYGDCLFVFSFTEVHVATVCVCVCVLSQLVEKSIVLIDELKRVVAGGVGVPSLYR